MNKQQCTAKEFQQETIFLGVCLLDRFLSKGFFRIIRSLQIVGIACLVLATKIEENQPYNRFFLKAAKADAEVEKRAKYLAVLALSDHEQLCYWPSTVAAGVVIMASVDGNQHGSYNQVIEIHMRTKENDLPECMTVWLLLYNGIFITSTK
ncbi:hypothetical protein CRYUN_Cryun21dG0031500 [Craigia yunnanensis]